MTRIMIIINMILTLGTGRTLRANRDHIGHMFIHAIIIWIACLFLAHVVATSFEFEKFMDKEWIRHLLAFIIAASGVALVYFATHRTPPRWVRGREALYTNLGYFLGIFGSGLYFFNPEQLAAFLTISSYVIMAIPFFLIAYVAAVGSAPIIIGLMPMALFDDLRNLRPTWQHVGRFTTMMATIATWLIFAGIVSIMFKTYYSLGATIILIMVSLWLGLATIGWGLQPSPRLTRRLHSAVIFLVIIPSLLGFISFTTWVHLTGYDIPQELTFKRNLAVREARDAKKQLAQSADKKLAERIANFKKQSAQGDTTATRKLGEVLDSLDSVLKQESIIKVAGSKLANIPSLFSDSNKTASGNTTGFVPMSYIYQDSIEIDGQWTQLETIPQNGYRFDFELPNDEVKIEWMFKKYPDTAQVLNNLAGFADMNVDYKGPRVNRVPAMIRSISGKTIKVLVTVTES